MSERMRDYAYMRGLLAMIASADRLLLFSDFRELEPRSQLVFELRRLHRDGLVEGSVEFDSAGACITCEVDGLTVEGQEFYKLIENEDVWEIVLGTLRGAGIDVSYPLLKEVCEEIVKRYVSSFIPEIPRR